MQTTLAVTALLMGLAGGPHCLAMCGTACAAIGRSVGAIQIARIDAARAPKAAQSTLALWAFQAGRVIGYSAMGGVAAASMQGLGWLSTQSAALRPVWTLFHVAVALMGLTLLWQARQPAWLEDSARKVWQSVRAFTGNVGVGPAGQINKHPNTAAPLLMGMLWSLLPCGLLYSALLVAAMSNGIAEGALVMALFAIGSGTSLMAGPWLWLKLRPKLSANGSSVRQRQNTGGQWAIRIAGLALFATSAWALWMGLVHNTAPWCAVP
jgi:uncharacterized protein